MANIYIIVIVICLCGLTLLDRLSATSSFMGIMFIVNGH